MFIDVCLFQLAEGGLYKNRDSERDGKEHVLCVYCPYSKTKINKEKKKYTHKRKYKENAKLKSNKLFEFIFYL